MSWLFSRALVEASLGDNCSDGELSAPLRSTPTPPACFSHGKTTDAWNPSQYGMTCRPLTASRGEDVLTWCREVSRVPTSARPTPTNEDSRATGRGCGAKWPASFAKCDRDSFGWRTFQQSLFGGLTEFYGTWPAWGLMLGGECWVVRMSVSRCGVTECGLWRPATSGDAVGRGYHGKLHGNHWPALPGQICQYLGLPIQCPETGLIAPWVYEELMGWPKEWSACGPLGTDRLHDWTRQHGRRWPLACIENAGAQTPSETR